MQLFQYWDADPPLEIAVCMDSMRDGQAGYGYRRFEDADARRYIATVHGTREADVWDRLAAPAARADYLRLLLVHRHGGIWLDASFSCRQPLSQFVARTTRNQAFGIGPIMSNGVLILHYPENAFIRACLDLLIDNVERRRFDSVLMATGPGTINAVRFVLLPDERDGIDYVASASTEWTDWGWRACVEAAAAIVHPNERATADCRDFDLISVADLDGWLAHWPSPHRRDGRHWRDFRNRIYR